MGCAPPVAHPKISLCLTQRDTPHCLITRYAHPRGCRRRRRERAGGRTGGREGGGEGGKRHAMCRGTGQQEQVSSPWGTQRDIPHCLITRCARPRGWRRRRRRAPASQTSSRHRRTCPSYRGVPRPPTGRVRACHLALAPFGMPEAPTHALLTDSLQAHTHVLLNCYSTNRFMHTHVLPNAQLT
jgi:hypothetical protein